MNRHAVQLIARGAINRMGNMLYDYGNSVWLASMGTIGKTVLGIYQISELVTSILVNPFGGVISDRFSRRKILMTTDLVCGLLCLAISFIRNDRWMIAASKRVAWRLANCKTRKENTGELTPTTCKTNSKRAL